MPIHATNSSGVVSDPTRIRVGNTDIDRVYVGARQVWPHFGAYRLLSRYTHTTVTPPPNLRTVRSAGFYEVNRTTRVASRVGDANSVTIPAALVALGAMDNPGAMVWAGARLVAQLTHSGRDYLIEIPRTGVGATSVLGSRATDGFTPVAFDGTYITIWNSTTGALGSLTDRGALVVDDRSYPTLRHSSGWRDFAWEGGVLYGIQRTNPIVDHNYRYSGQNEWFAQQVWPRGVATRRIINGMETLSGPIVRMETAFPRSSLRYSGLVSDGTNMWTIRTMGWRFALCRIGLGSPLTFSNRGAITGVPANDPAGDESFGGLAWAP